MLKFLLFFLLFFQIVNAQENIAALPNFLCYYEEMPIFLTNPYSKERGLNPAEERLINLIYDGLLIREVNSTYSMDSTRDTFKPNLAKEFQSVLLDNRWTYYFMLRKDIYWSNGQLVTPHDIEIFYEFLKEHLSQSSMPVYESFIQHQKLPPYLFHRRLTPEEKERCFGIRFAKSQKVFTSLFTYPIVFHEDLRKNFSEKPIGTGRYTVNQFKQKGMDALITLQKNQKHPLFQKSCNNIQKIVIKAYKSLDSKKIIEGFEKKQIQIIFKPNSTLRALFAGMISEGDDFKQYCIDTNNYHGMIFNHTKEYLSEDNGKKIRHALNLLCNKEFEGAWRSYFLSKYNKHLPSSKIDSMHQESWNEKALKELSEAGYTPKLFDERIRLVKSGKPMSLKIYMIANEDIRNKIMYNFVTLLSRIGIKVRLERIDMAYFNNNIINNILRNKEWDLCYWYFNGKNLNLFNEFQEIDISQLVGYQPSPELKEELKNLQTTPSISEYIESTKKIFHYCTEDPPFIIFGKDKIEIFTVPNLEIPDKLESARINLFNNMHEWYYQ